MRAAGGVVLREGTEGLEVAVVHRPAHGDWSLPKGKNEPGESDEECARREVLEETGFECELSVLLGLSEYRDNHHREKRVAFFLMRLLGGAFAVNDEVDELRWLPLAAAHELLSYDRERELLALLGQRAGESA